MTPGPSPDGKYCVLTDDKDHYWLQPLNGVDAREIQGVNPGDLLLEWHDDSNNLFVSRAVHSDVEIGFTRRAATRPERGQGRERLLQRAVLASFLDG